MMLLRVMPSLNFRFKILAHSEHDFRSFQSSLSSSPCSSLAHGLLTTASGRKGPPPEGDGQLSLGTQKCDRTPRTHTGAPDRQLLRQRNLLLFPPSAAR